MSRSSSARDHTCGFGVGVAVGVAIMKVPIVVLFGLSTTAANADPSRARVAALEPPAMTPEIVDGPTDPAKRTLVEVTADDADADRGMFLGSALTVPEHRVEASIRAVSRGAVIGIDAGLTGRIQISADAGKRFDDRTSTYAAGIKIAVVARRRWQLAVQGSYRRLSTDGGDFIAEINAPSGSAIGTVCVDAGCAVRASLGGGLVVTDHAIRDNGILLRTSAVFTGGLVIGTGRTRLLGDAMWIGDGVVGGFGVRVGTARISVDGGIGVTISPRGADVAPMAGLATRF